MTGDDHVRAFDSAGGVGSNARRRPSPVLDGPPRATSELEDRILAAALDLIARWGMGKTTLGDIARGAGCSRASVYRAFPGGKQELFVAVGRRELERFFAGIAAQIELAPSLEDALVAMLANATRGLAGHEAFTYVCQNEPEIVLPFLGFHQMDRLYGVATAALSPAVGRLLPDGAEWAVEWAARTVLTYFFNPSPEVDLSRPDHARRIVRQFLVPALQPVSHPAPALSVHA